MHRRATRISNICRNDLLLMFWFLNIAKKGIDMNLIAFHKLMHVYWLDSCPFGLGG